MAQPFARASPVLGARFAPSGARYGLLGVAGTAAAAAATSAASAAATVPRPGTARGYCKNPFASQHPVHSPTASMRRGSGSSRRKKRVRQEEVELHDYGTAASACAACTLA